MIGTVRPTHAGLPNHRREDDDRKQKEDTRNLKPYNPANATERAQKSTHSLGDSAAGLACRTAGLARRCAGTHRRGALRWPCQMLPCNTPGNANADAKHSADLLSLHSIYDVISDPDLRVLPASDCILRASEVR